MMKKDNKTATYGEAATTQPQKYTSTDCSEICSEAPQQQRLSTESDTASGGAKAKAVEQNAHAILHRSRARPSR